MARLVFGSKTELEPEEITRARTSFFLRVRLTQI